MDKIYFLLNNTVEALLQLQKVIDDDVDLIHFN